MFSPTTYLCGSRVGIKVTALSEDERSGFWKRKKSSTLTIWLFFFTCNLTDMSNLPSSVSLQSSMCYKTDGKTLGVSTKDCSSNVKLPLHRETQLGCYKDFFPFFLLTSYHFPPVKVTFNAIKAVQEQYVYGRKRNIKK